MGNGVSPPRHRGTLQFEILVPEEETDTVMLYEVYASPEAFQTHWNGGSLQQAKQEGAGLQVSLNGVRCNVVEQRALRRP
jgi:quinol monooxygenase YgiN